jgi:hypothetical protein
MDTNAGRISLSLVDRRLSGVEQITASERNRFVVDRGFASEPGSERSASLSMTADQAWRRAGVR